MYIVKTAAIKTSSKDLENITFNLDNRLKRFRFIHDLEKLTIVSIAMLLKEAKIHYPVQRNDISLYIGVDGAIEDIKDEYFKNILEEGFLNASPLLFPFTTPNVIAAQASIAFDIRGETITFPVKDSFGEVISYAAECILNGYTKIAITGGIKHYKKYKTSSDGRYFVEFYTLEEIESADKRGIRNYQNV